MATLITRQQAQASAITPTTLIHIVATGDTSQSPDGSSYKASLGQLQSLFGGNTDLYITGGTYSSDTLNLFNNSGGTITITGFTSPFTGGVVTGETIFTGGLSATTIGSPTDCVEDLYVSNIHSCSPLNINPLDEGNVYFGSTSGVTIDVANIRLGVNNSSPQYILDISGTTNEKLQFITSLPTSRLLVSTNQSNRLTRIAVNDDTNTGGVEFGFRGTTEPTFVNYGKQGDSFIRASNNSNGINIIEAPTSSILIPAENYIRFYAGQNANGTTPDIHIQGSGSTRGNVGVGTATPTTKLDVSGKTRTSQLQVTTSPNDGYILTSDASGNATWSSLYTKSTTNITSATILGTLSAGNPVQLLAAPSVGKYYDWHAFVRYTYGGTAYNCGNVGFWYIEQGGADLSYGFNLNTITTDQTWKATEGSGQSNLVGPSGFESSAINIRVNDALTLGNGTISVDIYYRELDL